MNHDSIWGHDHKLSVDIGPRVAGSPAEDSAVDYVQGLFEGFGFEVERETFAAYSQNYADVIPSRYQEGYASWQFRPAPNGKFTGPDAPVSGELADVGDGSDIDPVELDGKIVLVDWLESADERNAMIADLDSAGAAAIVLSRRTARKRSRGQETYRRS